MASQPTVVTSRRRQHELLRSWTGWPLTSVLIDPAEVAQVRVAGWSGTRHRDPETGARIVGTADGLGFGVDDSWHTRSRRSRGQSSRWFMPAGVIVSAIAAGILGVTMGADPLLVVLVPLMPLMPIV
jgi:hypothetical protein